VICGVGLWHNVLDFLIFLLQCLQLEM
jgi:hypothetical protein